MKIDNFINLLIPLSILFVFGVGVGAFFPNPSFTSIYVVLGLTVLGIIGLIFLATSDLEDGVTKTAVIFMVICIVFAIGWSRYSYSLRKVQGTHIKEYVTEGFGGPTRIIQGKVVEQPQVSPNQTRLIIKPTLLKPTPESEDSIQVDEGQILLQVKPYYKTNVDYEKLASNEIYGDVLRIKATLTQPFEQSNPYGFGWKRFLNARGIYGAVFFTESLKMVEEKPGNPIWQLALYLQTEMLKTIKKTMPYPQSAFLGGATLGLREGLAYALTPFGEGNNLITNEFGAAGTNHVLAVSGLHVGVIATAFWVLFTGMRLPKTVAAPLVIVGLVIFTIITGARPATVRASIMAGFTLLGMAYLDRDLGNSLLLGIGIAGIFLLSMNPKLIFEASFTLSFMAVLALILFADKIDRLLSTLRGLSFIVFVLFLATTTLLCNFYWNWFFQVKIYIPYLLGWFGLLLVAKQIDRRKIIAGGIGYPDIPTAVRGLIAAQFAVQIGMMLPLSSYYFLRYPFAGNFTNLLAIPLVGVVVPLGLMSGILGMIPGVGEWMALILNAGNYLPVSGFLWICHLAAEHMIYPAVRKMKPIHLLIFYGLVAIFAAWDYISEWFQRLWFWLVTNVFKRPIVRATTVLNTLVGGLCLVALVGLSWGNHTPKNPKVTVLSVGYGSAVAIQTPSGKNLLIGAGARIWDWHNRENKPERMNKGKMTVAPFFLSQRIKTLDLLGTLSIEPQRTGGLPYITRQFVVKRTFGPLHKSKFLPLNKNNYTHALDDDYLAEQSDASWFKHDYYGNWKRWWKPIRNKEIPYQWYGRGEVLFQDSFKTNNGRKKIVLKSLHPAKDSDYDYKSAQNRSLVLSLRIGEKSILLPGDIKEDAQWDLIKHYEEELQHDVMLVPSNGASKSSAIKPFFESVDPSYVVFSTGTQEMTIKGPKAKSLEKNLSKNWQKYNSWMNEKSVFRTDKDHAIIIEYKNNGLSVSPFRKEA